MSYDTLFNQYPGYFLYYTSNSAGERVAVFSGPVNGGVEQTQEYTKWSLENKIVDQKRRGLPYEEYECVLNDM